ncbi:MAG: TonB-dependent receptor [Povalibacter sp.]
MTIAFRARVVTSCVTACVAFTSSWAQEAQAPAKTLGTVTVVGTRPTSLPTQIPTTIEGITREQIADAINASDAEDALKYFPSLLVRKRYIGDYDHAVLASRASGTGNSARSLVYADGILLSNLLGNGATYTPRWGMVTPEEIERVDVLYGPFSAAYSGNSAGAVVDYVTRMPEQFEAHVRASSFGQQFDVYRTNETYRGYQGSASIGDRFGAFSVWLDYNRLDSDSQPLVYANRLLSAGVPGSSGVPVTGAVAGRNPRNQDWWLLGTSNQSHTLQDHAKAKLAYDFSETLRATYTLGWWRNQAERNSDTYLRDASGTPVYSGSVNIDGRVFTLTPADFAPSRGDLQHFIQGLSLKQGGGGVWDWEIAASVYDYDRDEIRSATAALPAADAGGAGRIADQSGTGWNTLALKTTWRPGGSGVHIVDVGYQRDSFRLRTEVSNTANWLDGPAASRFSAFRGNTLLQSLYAQDTWHFATNWRATLGARAERWEASEGELSDSLVTLQFPDRSENFVSPKAAIAYQLTSAWALKASVGRAVRMPTVAELYQGSITTNAIVNNDPNLKPERSWTGELTAERELERGSVRATAFHEDTRDALYSQTNVTVTPNVTNIQNVDHIRTTGLELAYEVADIFSVLDLSASLTYAHSRILENENFPASEGKWQPRVPDWRGNVLATYHMGEKWTASLGARYSGRQYNTLDNSDPNGDAYTGVSDFFTVDARVRYHMSDQLSLSLSADNLNGDNYWNFHHYPQRSYAAEVSMEF